MAPNNDRVIRALLQQPVDRRPIWLMRQAGRYLPEYRQLRRQVPDFMTFCKTPELACQATLQPLARFPLDAAIVFSDILTIPDAMGMKLHFQSGSGPVFSQPIRTMQDIKRLKPVEIEKSLGYVMETIRQTLTEIDNKLPLIGFAGSPWTVATYMVEGQASRTFSTVRSLVYQAPEVLHALLSTLEKVTVDYLNAQIAAGVHAIMLFDTWGGILSDANYAEFSLTYMQNIAAQLNTQIQEQRIPIIFFVKQAAAWLEQIANSGCDAIGIDSSMNMRTAQQRVSHRVALQGNLDPYLLWASPDKIQQAVIDMLDDFGPGPGLVCNLGHGIDPHTPIDKLSTMVEAVHRYGRLTDSAT